MAEERWIQVWNKFMVGNAVELKNRTLNLHNLNESVVDMGAIVGSSMDLSLIRFPSANLQFK